MSKSKDSQKLTNPKAYNQRDVRGLAPVSKWTAADEQLQKEHNRLLQPGFLTREASEIVADARLMREDWLTDIYCPTVESALMLNVGKELIINYRIGENDLNSVNHNILENIKKIKPDTIQNLENQINAQLALTENLDSKAAEYLTKKNINLEKQGEPAIPINDYTLSAAKRILVDTQKKQLTHQLASGLIQQELKDFAPVMGLENKPKFASNKDYSFLGAAGSGKSTISQQFIADDDKDKFIMLATDVYRAFNMPNTESHESKITKDVFTRTQDTTYLVKELVLQDLQKNPDLARANIIFDAVFLEPAVKKILSKGDLTSLVAAYGPVGYEGIVERADMRAKNPNAAPADLGRFVNTTSLLEGHSNASERLLSSIPPNVSITIYNTDVERGKSAVVIGKIDAKNMTMEIDDLKTMTEFLNKKNINTEAVNQVDLIYNTKNPLNILSTHSENKAKTLIDLVPKGRFKEPYTVAIKDKDQPYMVLSNSESGKVQMEVLDKGLFQKKSMADTVEGSILRAATRQIEQGSLEASLNLAFSKGDKQSFKETKTALDISNSITKTNGKSHINNVSMNSVDKSVLDQATRMLKNSQISYQIINQAGINIISNNKDKSRQLN